MLQSAAHTHARLKIAVCDVIPMTVITMTGVIRSPTEILGTRNKQQIICKINKFEN